MTSQQQIRTPARPSVASGVQEALAAAEASVRLQAALAAGARPAGEQVEILVQRCGVEPDFLVRDMLTWALTRHERSATVARLVEETRSDSTRSRSQALHTLSRIGDPAGWAAITSGLLTDEDDDVARSAWRAAVTLVPADEAPALARTLATQLGRGDPEVRLSLSRALLALGEAGAAVVAAASDHPDEAVRSHAAATERLARHPEDASDVAVAEARRIVALTDAPGVP